MTAVTRATDAPRAASAISSSSTRCSCTGGTSGWMRYTSRSRQLAWSCTWRQSLANRGIRTGLRGTPRYRQISSASAGCALPPKITISAFTRPPSSRSPARYNAAYPNNGISATATAGPLGKRATLMGMETPGSAPVDAATADVCAVAEQPAKAPGPAWLFLFTPRWLGWHLFVVVAFWGMLWLGDWQFHRAMSGNGLSWAYTFEWPLFAGFGVVFWARTVRGEFGERRGPTTAEVAAAAAEAAAGPILPAGIGTPPNERAADDA